MGTVLSLSPSSGPTAVLGNNNNNFRDRSNSSSGYARHSTFSIDRTLTGGSVTSLINGAVNGNAGGHIGSNGGHQQNYHQYCQNHQSGNNSNRNGHNVVNHSFSSSNSSLAPNVGNHISNGAGGGKQANPNLKCGKENCHHSKNGTAGLITALPTTGPGNNSNNQSSNGNIKKHAMFINSLSWKRFRQNGQSAGTGVTNATSGGGGGCKKEMNPFSTNASANNAGVQVGIGGAKNDAYDDSTTHHHQQHYQGAGGVRNQPTNQPYQTHHKAAYQHQSLANGVTIRPTSLIVGNVSTKTTGSTIQTQTPTSMTTNGFVNSNFLGALQEQQNYENNSKNQQINRHYKNTFRMISPQDYHRPPVGPNIPPASILTPPPSSGSLTPGMTFGNIYTIKENFLNNTSTVLGHAPSISRRSSSGGDTSKESTIADIDYSSPSTSSPPPLPLPPQQPETVVGEKKKGELRFSKSDLLNNNVDMRQSNSSGSLTKAHTPVSPTHHAKTASGKEKEMLKELSQIQQYQLQQFAQSQSQATAIKERSDLDTNDQHHQHNKSAKLFTNQHSIGNQNF